MTATHACGSTLYLPPELHRQFMNHELGIGLFRELNKNEKVNKTQDIN